MAALALGSMAATSAEPTFIALGIQSAAGAAEKSNAETYRRRRARLRQDVRAFHSYGNGVALRFVLAGAQTRKNAAALDEARKENSTSGDMLLLNTSEGRFTCSRKYLLWMQVALELFPTARYISIGDDDIYVQLDHFYADLKSIGTHPAATSHVLYGLIMWKAYYNNATMVTSTGFTGWGFTDWAAVAQRTQMEACRSPTVNVSVVCPNLREDHVEAAQHNHIGSPPFPMVNGPLSALSRELAATIAHHTYPPQWLAALVKTPHIAQALARPGGPRRSSFACWPVVDSILGYWVTAISLSQGNTVTLVNTPVMRQHHPWPSAIRGAFSNASIILHGLKRPGHERFRELAIKRGSGPFEPYIRECGTCKEMGWSTWPNSPLDRWRCCGSKVEPRALKASCRGRMCPSRVKGASRAVRAARAAADAHAAAASSTTAQLVATAAQVAAPTTSQPRAEHFDSKISSLEAELVRLKARKRAIESGNST